MARFWKSRYTRPINTFVPLPLDYLRKVVDKENKGFADIKDAAGNIDTTSLNYNAWSPNDVAVAEKFNKDRMDYISGAIGAIDPSNLTKENWRNQKDKAASFVMKAKRLNASKNTQGTDAWQVEQNKKASDASDVAVNKLGHYDADMKRNAIYEGRRNYLARDAARTAGSIGSFDKYISGSYYDKDKFYTAMKSIVPQKIGKSSNWGFNSEWLGHTYKTTETRDFATLLSKGSGLYRSNNELQSWHKELARLNSYNWTTRDANGNIRHLTENERTQRLSREYSSIETGGLDANKYNNYMTGLANAQEAEANGKKDAVKNYYNSNPFKIEDMMARGTIAGDLLVSNANALQQEDVTKNTTYSHNPNFNADGTRKGMPTTGSESRGGNTTEVFNPTNFVYDYNKAKNNGTLKNNIYDFGIKAFSSLNSKANGRGKEMVNAVYNLNPSLFDKQMIKLGYTPDKTPGFNWTEGNKSKKYVWKPNDFNRGMATIMQSGDYGDKQYSRSVNASDWANRFMTPKIGVETSELDNINDFAKKVHSINKQYTNESSLTGAEPQEYIVQGTDLIITSESPHFKNYMGYIKRSLTGKQLGTDLEDNPNISGVGFSINNGEFRAKIKTQKYKEDGTVEAGKSTSHYVTLNENNIGLPGVIGANLIVSAEKYNLGTDQNIVNKQTGYKYGAISLIPIDELEQAGSNTDPDKGFTINAARNNGHAVSYQYIGTDGAGNNHYAAYTYDKAENGFKPIQSVSGSSEFVGNDGILEAYGTANKEAIKTSFLIQ